LDGITEETTTPSTDGVQSAWVGVSRDREVIPGGGGDGEYSRDQPANQEEHRDSGQKRAWSGKKTFDRTPPLVGGENGPRRSKGLRESKREHIDYRSRVTGEYTKRVAI